MLLNGFQACAQEVDPNLRVEQDTRLIGLTGTIIPGEMRFIYKDEKGQDVPEMSWDATESAFVYIIDSLNNKSDAQIETFFKSEFKDKLREFLKTRLQTYLANKSGHKW